jgi:hypothetical protein
MNSWNPKRAFAHRSRFSIIGAIIVLISSIVIIGLVKDESPKDALYVSISIAVVSSGFLVIGFVELNRALRERIFGDISDTAGQYIAECRSLSLPNRESINAQFLQGVERSFEFYDVKLVQRFTGGKNHEVLRFRPAEILDYKLIFGRNCFLIRIYTTCGYLEVPASAEIERFVGLLEACIVLNKEIDPQFASKLREAPMIKTPLSGWITAVLLLAALAAGISFLFDSL